MTGSPYLVILAFLAAVGALIGRFLNVCAERLPQHEPLKEQLASLIRRGPICYRCNATPSFLERVPLVGFFIQRGRCYSCNSRLPGTRCVVA